MSSGIWALDEGTGSLPTETKAGREAPALLLEQEHSQEEGLALGACKLSSVLQFSHSDGVAFSDAQNESSQKSETS